MKACPSADNSRRLIKFNLFDVHRLVTMFDLFLLNQLVDSITACFQFAIDGLRTSDFDLELFTLSQLLMSRFPTLVDMGQHRLHHFRPQ